MIRAGARDGVHVELGEVTEGFWCAAVALEPVESGTVLALSVTSPAEPNTRQRDRIYRALRREASGMGRTLATRS